MAHGILVPQPGIEPAAPALEVRILTTELAGKSRIHFIIRVKKNSHKSTAKNHKFTLKNLEKMMKYANPYETQQD